MQTAKTTIAARLSANAKMKNGENFMDRLEEFELDKHVAMLGSSGNPHRFSLKKAYARLLEQAHATENKEKKLSYYHDALRIRSLGLSLEPLLWAQNPQECDLIEEQIYFLSVDLYGSFEDKTLESLEKWAERIYYGVSSSTSIYTHLQSAYQHLLEVGRTEEALNFSLLLGRCYLSGGEHELAVYTFREIYMTYSRTKGMTDADTLFALHRLGWVYYEIDRIDLAKETFQQEINLRLSFEGKDSPGILSCQEAIRLIDPT